MSDIARLTVALYANSAQFVADLDKAKGKSKTWSKEVGGYFKAVAAVSTVAMTAAAASLVIVYKEQAALIDQTAKFADKIGVTTEALTQLRYASELTGVGANNLDMAMQRMTRRIEEAAQGTGSALPALKEMKIDIQALADLQPDQQMMVLADAMAEVDKQSTRVSHAFKLFDSGGVGMVNMLAGGSAGLKEMAAEADSLGITLDRVKAAKIEMANDAMYKLDVTTNALKQNIATELAPIVAMMADEFRSYAAEQGGMNNMIIAGIDAAVTGVTFLIDTYRGLELIMKSINVGVDLFQVGMTNAAQPIANAMHFIGATIFKVITSPLLAALKVAGAFSDDIDAMASQLQAFGNQAPPKLFDSADANQAMLDLNQSMWELRDLASQPLPSDGINAWYENAQKKINDAATAYAKGINRNTGGSTGAAAEDPAVSAYRTGTDALQVELQRRLALQAAGESQAAVQESFAYQDRMVKLATDFEAAYMTATDNQALMAELENSYFADREALYQIHQANITDIQATADQKRLEYQQATAMELLQFGANAMSMTTNMLKQAGMEHSGVYKALFALQQAAAIPSMIVATEEASTKALAAFPGPAGIALSQATRVMGYASIGIAAGQAIGGMAHDGISEIPSEGTWLLNKGERVYTNESANKLDRMYDSLASGGSGQGVTIHQEFNISGSGDAELRQLLEQAARSGAEQGYQKVFNDYRSNGSISQLSARR